MSTAAAPVVHSKDVTAARNRWRIAAGSLAATVVALPFVGLLQTMQNDLTGQSRERRLSRS